MKAVPSTVSYRSRDYDQVVRMLRDERNATEATVLILSGPHKTAVQQAAAETARQLGKTLNRIELGAVVSKYIGETEKNLELVFARAEALGAVLFFDEGDALSGRSSDVKDSHDRYANLETGYLLERIEKFHGIVMLATNTRSSTAYKRLSRRQIIVELT